MCVCVCVCERGVGEKVIETQKEEEEDRRGNRDPEGHRKSKQQGSDTEHPSCADGGRGMRQKPREMWSERRADRSSKQKPANICCRLGSFSCLHSTTLEEETVAPRVTCLRSHRRKSGRS